MTAMAAMEDRHGWWRRFRGQHTAAGYMSQAAKVLGGDALGLKRWLKHREQPRDVENQVISDIMGFTVLLFYHVLYWDIMSFNRVLIELYVLVGFYLQNELFGWFLVAQGCGAAVRLHGLQHRHSRGGQHCAARQPAPSQRHSEPP